MATPSIQQSTIKLNDDQLPAWNAAWSDDYRYHLFYGGGGSGKSFLIFYIIILRAMMAPQSRHLIVRRALNSCRNTLFHKTAREVINSAWPGLLATDQIQISESESTIRLSNGSFIRFDGLDDEERMTKVLGDEYNTIWLNECNELTYSKVSLLEGRLRYKAFWDERLKGGRRIALTNKFFFDCNPIGFDAWEYRAFKKHLNPIDGDALGNPERWIAHKLNPHANLNQLGEGYIENMAATMSRADRTRFIEGEWSDRNGEGVFNQAIISENRLPKPKSAITPSQILALLPAEPDRIIIAVDPAISDKKNSDLTGISVVALLSGDPDPHAYVLADLSMKGRPEQWAGVVAQAYREWGASRVVAEKNQGGDMVESVLRQAYRHLPYKHVHAHVNKTSRAEPVSTLYERNLVHHVGTLEDLETQMCSWGTPAASKSPDRMDALVWAITELFDLGRKGPAKVHASYNQRTR